MKKIRVLMEYKCYPVWLYDDEGNIEGTRLPPELLGDRGLDKKLMSIQKRFDATYVDTPEEEAAFWANLRAAVAELAEKYPEGYSLELPAGLVE